MPFAAAPMSDEEDQQNKEKNGAGTNISGESTSFATGVPGQEASGAGKKTEGSGGKFANIQSYLDANKSQGEEMGQKIQSDTIQKADDAQNKISSLQAQAPKVQAYDPNAAYQNATQLSAVEKDAYNKAKQGYKGPQTLDQVSGYGDTQKAVSAAAQKVTNAGTAEGQQALLKEAYAKPSYSSGQNALDQSIMQGASGAKKGFEDLSQKYSGLNTMFDTAAKDVGAKIGEAAKTGMANQQAIGKGEADQWSGLVNPIQARAKAQNELAAAQIAKAQSGTRDNSFDDGLLSQFGLSEGQNIYDMDLSSYITPDYTQAGVNNVATGDERQKYAALQALIGDPSRNEITAEGKTINPVLFDKANFDKNLSARKAEYDADFNPKETEYQKQQAEVDRTNAQWYFDNPHSWGGDSMGIGNAIGQGMKEMVRKKNLARDSRDASNAAYKSDRKIKKG